VGWLGAAGQAVGARQCLQKAMTPIERLTSKLDVCAVPLQAYPAGAAGTALGQQIAAVLGDPAVARAHWGIAVTALDGTPLYGLDEGKMFRPASTAKLFTTVAAMGLLGPDTTFKTRLDADGEIDADGVLHGSLVLVGGGDANFAGGYQVPFVAAGGGAATRPPTLDDIEAMADAVLAKGVDRIEGDIVGDDSALEDVPYPEGSSDEDMLWGYGAPASALTVHDNQVELTVKAGDKPGAAAMVMITPGVRYFDVSPLPGKPGGVETLDAGSNGVLIERAPGSRTVHVNGAVAAKYGPVREELAIDDPAKYAALALREALERRSVQVDGGLRTVHYRWPFAGSFLAESKKEPDFPGIGCEAQNAQVLDGRPGAVRSTLAEHVSPTLAEDLVLTMKDSQNLHAEMMLRNISAGCEHTLISSLQHERRFLTRAGLSGDDFVFYDGSGLSVKDLVTPRAEVQLLAFAATQPWFAEWKAALPLGGVDGTLSGRFKEAPLKGHVFAKTGTLGESRALSGYVDAASGRTVIFSILVDNHTPGSSADRVVMDKIVAAIAGAN